AVRAAESDEPPFPAVRGAPRAGPATSLVRDRPSASLGTGRWWCYWRADRRADRSSSVRRWRWRLHRSAVPFLIAQPRRRAGASHTLPDLSDVVCAGHQVPGDDLVAFVRTERGQAERL